MSVTDTEPVRLTSIREQLREQIEAGDRPLDAARSILSRCQEAALRLLAEEHLFDMACRLKREEERQVRRAAIEQRAEHRAAVRARNRQADIERKQKDLEENIERALTRFATDLKAEWDQQLLESTFGTGDGRVSWGAATVEQHRAHMEIVSTHIVGAEADLALHQEAIEVIVAGNGKCLNDVVVPA